MTLEQVAFDIETTGFGVDDEVTTVGFAVPLGVRVFVQTRGRAAPNVEAAVRDRVETHVQVSTHESERKLFKAVGSFTADRLADDDVMLVGFNAELWKLGFDLPFLRTRLAQADVEWPFRNVPYADLLPVVTNRFNTTIEAGESRSDLAGVYKMLCDGQYNELDPFAESSEAVVAFEDGRFTDLVVHNVADILRTKQLGRLSERYCSKSDFKLKSLTATTQEYE